MKLRTPAPRSREELEHLCRELVAELGRLNGESAEQEGPPPYRTLLDGVLAWVWQGVYEGDERAPRRGIEQLLAARPWMVTHRHQPGAAGVAASAIEASLHHLYVAADAVVAPAAERRLADRQRSEAEQEVARALAASGEYLRRSEVRDLLPPDRRPTPERVYQILCKLQDEGFAFRQRRPARGGSEVSFFTLSPRGRRFAERLASDAPHFATKADHLEAQSVPLPGPIRDGVLHPMARILRSGSPHEARILKGLLESCRSPMYARNVLRQLPSTRELSEMLASIDRLQELLLRHSVELAGPAPPHQSQSAGDARARVLFVGSAVLWEEHILDFVTAHHGKPVVAMNQEQAIDCLETVRSGRRSFRCALIHDVLPPRDLMDVARLDERLLKQSLAGGMTICSHVRRNLSLPPQVLPIGLITSATRRAGDERLTELAITPINRDADGSLPAAETFLEQWLEAA